MGWFHWVMLVFGILYAVSTPVVLAKAMRRKEWQRLFELIVSVLFTSSILVMTLWPAVIENAWAAWPPLRWLWLLSSLLFLADWFGFSRWLFKMSSGFLATGRK